jgi:hypothetical protein
MEAVSDVAKIGMLRSGMMAVAVSAMTPQR